MFVLFHIHYLFINKITGSKSKDALLIKSGNDLHISDKVCLPIEFDSSVEVVTNWDNINEVCLRIDSDISVEAATKRVFVVGHRFILSDLKKLAHSLGMRRNFVL